MSPEKPYTDSLGIVAGLSSAMGEVRYFSLNRLSEKLGKDITRMPYTLKILLESVVRNIDGSLIGEDDVKKLVFGQEGEVPFMPARVLMQDFTGVPALVDLAVMRDALADLGGDAQRVDPRIPVDLVIDHSVQVDRYATRRALLYNADMEFKRNRERYELLRWGAAIFKNLRVVPPATGICHQVNLEYLAKAVQTVQTAHTGDETYAFPDTLVGTDSHTPMIDGLGVLGWGVGGIEAEAVMLGQPYYMLVPDVIGFRLTGRLRPGTTPTDIVLHVIERLRKYGVVGKFVEFFGPGVASMSVADRALVSNMSPETGATVVYFPADANTLLYLSETGRPKELVDLVEKYMRAQGLFRDKGTPGPDFTDVIEFDLASIEPSIAGPKWPQDRIPLNRAHTSIPEMLKSMKKKCREVHFSLHGRDAVIEDGSVVIAAITSCTNTSNPTVMVGAGMLAKKAVQLGLEVPPHVKTSLAPGSKVVTRYLDGAELTPYLEALGFHLVGYGCTTCIGNSGPLLPEISRAIRENDLVTASVLSGNRNFEGRIHQEVRTNFLMSPPLVVAYALAGKMKNLTKEPVGYDRNGGAVYLSDIWPSEKEVQDVMQKVLSSDFFTTEYANVYTGNETWNQVKVKKAKRYAWNDTSTYIKKPPFFNGLTRQLPAQPVIEDARVLALLGETVTTDHISPAGSIPAESPAGKWLIEHGVKPEDFNSYGSRRGNHEVMMRGTFGNIRIKNLLVPGTEGGVTKLIPDGTVMPIYDAAVEYRGRGIPLIVIAGREYGAGSSRDWAAKGTLLLGVKAVIAESFERIHRSNLIGMGVLPLQFIEGQNVPSLGLTGMERYRIEPVHEAGQMLKVEAVSDTGELKGFSVLARLDTYIEFEYYRNGGILHTVLRQMARD